MTRTKFTFEYRGSKKRSRFDATYDADTREKRRVPGSTFHANTPRHIAKTCRDYRRPEIRRGGTKVSKDINFPRYHMECSGENEILRGIIHVVSLLPLHFMLYRGNLDYFLFLDRVRRSLNIRLKDS